MPHTPKGRILSINTGSSSLKAGLYVVGDGEALELSAEIRRIGLPDSQMRIVNTNGDVLLDQGGNLANHEAALQALLSWLSETGNCGDLVGVGHRVVHGGSSYSEPQLVTDELVRTLRGLVPIDPMHLPQAIDAIESTRKAFPGIPQVACFDTAFHRHMPHVAQMYALPRQLLDSGIVRYGFHGLSYEYIMSELRRIDPAEAERRVVIAHLGNGASMAAVRGGAGVDTTMGFTPTGGLVMGTRVGDVDPGVLLHLLQERHMDPSSLNTLLNRQSGLLGVSGISADMHDLEEHEGTNPRAADAIALFCYTARKFLGALTTVLGGLDTLVFTAGIGQHSASTRAMICEGLQFLGIELDPHQNAQHAPMISRSGGRVLVRVMRTDEDLMIARHTHNLIA